MFLCQRIIHSIGKEVIQRNTRSLLRQNALRNHSVLTTYNIQHFNNTSLIPNYQRSIFKSPNKESTSSLCYDEIYRNYYSTEPPKSVTASQKLKKAVAEYGSVVIVFHVGISLLSLGICYTLIANGLDLAAFVQYIGIDMGMESEHKLATTTGTFVVAYAVHKVFAPARILVTLGVAPLIVKHLRRIGFLKAPIAKKVT